MRWIGRLGRPGHMELDKTEARQGDEAKDNGPPLYISTLAISVIFAVMLAVFWYVRSH